MLFSQILLKTFSDMTCDLWPRAAGLCVWPRVVLILKLIIAARFKTRAASNGRGRTGVGRSTVGQNGAKATCLSEQNYFLFVVAFPERSVFAFCWRTSIYLNCAGKLWKRFLLGEGWCWTGVMFTSWSHINTLFDLTIDEKWRAEVRGRLTFSTQPPVLKEEM